MEESSVEVAPPVRRIVRRSGGGVVPIQKGPSALSRIASKVVPVVLAASAIGGSAGLVHESMNSDSDNRGATVTFIPKVEASEEAMIQESDGIFDMVFHGSDNAQKTEARQEVDMYKSKIAAKPGYVQEHQVIPLKYERQIEQTAMAYGISKDTLMGIVSVENGGGVDITNKSSGARGVTQFLPDTARQYGLRVNSEFDERTNPDKSIAATGKYLEQNKALFGGDEGLAIWSYHAGAGIVFRALRTYFLDTNNVDIGDYVDAIVTNNPAARESVEEKTKELMKKDGLDIYKLLKNEAVQKNVVEGLDDFSGSYPFQVLAAGELLNERSNNVVASQEEQKPILASATGNTSR